jgi:PST family polysaccharide transporter
MTLLHITNIIVPLLLFPYLIRVLGIDTFGLWSFVLGIMNYLIILIDFGFDLTATKKVALYKDNQEELNKIFSRVFTIKLLLIVISFFVVVVVTLSNKYSPESALFYLAFGMVAGQALFPGWFFQGVEKMFYITVINVVSKITFALLIIFFVKDTSDIYLAAIFNSLGYILAGIVSIYFVYKHFSIRFIPQTIDSLKPCFWDTWYVFLSKATVSLYTSVNIIILGFMTNNITVSYYAIASKIFYATVGFVEPALQALYPRFIKMHSNSKENFFEMNEKLTKFILLVMFPISASMFYFSTEILQIVTGQEEIEPVFDLVLKIYAIVIAIAPLASQYTRMLVAVDQTKLMNKIVLVAGVINMIAAPLLIHFFGLEGFSYLLLFLGFYIVITKWYFIYKEKQKI